jgi:glycosyltransferase involved in cell wall biosynthesis
MARERSKLAYICPWFSTEYKGSLYNLLEELSRDIDVVCITARQKYIQYFKKNEKYHKKIEFINPNFKIHRFESVAPRDIIIPKDIEQILNKEKPDVVQSDEFFRFTTIKAGKWAKKNNIPFIINSRMRYRPGIARNFAISIFKILAKDVVKYAGKIIATQGDESKKEFLRWFPDTRNKIIMIPNSIDPYKFKHITKRDGIRFKKKYKIPKNKKVILDVARIYPVKRIDLLVKVFSLIKKEHNDVVLVVVGPHEEKEFKKVKKIIKKLGLIIGKDVFFTGPIDNDYIGPAYASADIFINTSETEGICYSFLEAMCFKLPILAFDVGGNKYTIGKDLIFKFGDVKSMSRKALEILEKNKKTDFYGNLLNNKLLKEFDINKNKRKLLGVYENEIRKRKLG